MLAPERPGSSKLVDVKWQSVHTVSLSFKRVRLDVSHPDRHILRHHLSASSDLSSPQIPGMASNTSTFATLRALHMLVGDALDEIQRVFSQTTSNDTPPSSASRSPSPVCQSSPEPSQAACSFPPTPCASFPPTPISVTFPSTISSNTDTNFPGIDYPSPDMPYASNSLSEQAAAHPDVCAAASKIVAACGQMSHIVHRPFLSLCDALMSYNLPACVRLVEHLHIAEILREAEDDRQRRLTQAQVPSVSSSGPDVPSQTIHSHDGVQNSNTGYETVGYRSASYPEGMHIVDITNAICTYAGSNYVDSNHLVHVLRLLSTHHIFRETAPDTFALTRVSSLLDSGKSVTSVFSSPETKYEDTGGTAAFAALTTDELFKSAAYLTEAFTGVLSPPSRSTGSKYDGLINALSTHTPRTRSSSVLTRIVYPEDEGFQPPSRLVPSAESLEDISAYSLSKDAPSPSPPLATEPPLRPIPPTVHLAPVKEASRQLGQEIERFEGEKLPAFNLAFHTSVPYFDWLEDGGEDPLGGTGRGACVHSKEGRGGPMHHDVQHATLGDAARSGPRNSHRLERFSKAMKGTSGWEAPRAILGGFDWNSLPEGSTVVDVGGGIGSTTMILARAFNNSAKKHNSIGNDALKPPPSNTTHHHKAKHPSDPSILDDDELQGIRPSKNDKNFRFIVQDRPVVTNLGIAAWRSQCPEMLESGQVEFQNQDFFQPQAPLRPPHISNHPAVYLLRVVLHDWPDQPARRILINLRIASSPETRLLIADHVLPLACVDEGVDEPVDGEKREESSVNGWTLASVLSNVEGAERTLAPAPLLPNLGKASANAYWMDLLMHITFNGKERTLRELCALALSAGWRITRMTRPEGTLFAHLVCEPIALPDDAMAIYNAVVLSSPTSTAVPVISNEPTIRDEAKSPHPARPPAPVPLLPSPILERSSSRCGTPTFGSRVLLPNDDDLQTPSRRSVGTARKWLKSKGLGVRSVVMQKADRQREEPNAVKGSSKGQEDTQSGVHASPSHTRVWWKKSPPNSAGASTTSIHDLTVPVMDPRQTGRGRRTTLRGNERPSTPLQSPRLTPGIHPWPSTESVPIATPEPSPPMPHNRRPSIASITRKLSFAKFGRRPSVVDLNEPPLTPPPSARLTDLAPSPGLDSDAGRKLKHLQSSPALGRAQVAGRAERSHIPRRPSLSFASHVPALQPVPKPPVPRRPDVVGSHKRGILVKTPNTSPSISEQSCPNEGVSTELPVRTRRQRSVTLLSSPAGATRISTQEHRTTWARASADMPPEPTSPQGAKRTPEVPKLPRRLSIPLLRRKQSQAVVQDAVDEGGGSGQ